MTTAQKFKLNLFKFQAAIFFALWVVIVFVSMTSGFISGAIISFLVAIFILFLLSVSSWMLGIQKIVAQSVGVKTKKMNRIGF